VEIPTDMQVRELDDELKYSIKELLFELKGARVTPHIATLGGTSYQIADIGSVHVVRRRKYNPLAVIIFFLGWAFWLPR
jgi:hypothetical protein